VQASTTVRVAIVDDHHFSRQGLRALLEADGMRVVGEAVDQRGAVSIARSLNPDVVVLDLIAPGSAGEAVRGIAAERPDVRTVVLTDSTDPADVHDAMAAGAAGYLLKDTPAPGIVSAIRLAAAAQVVVSDEAMRALGSRLPPLPAWSSEGSRAPQLSERERQILRLIVEGANNEEIGQALSISRHTVKQHVSNICAALGVSGRVQAAVRAVREGLD
jgi:DNA-binding NarL/FixJ family response regulator